MTFTIFLWLLVWGGMFTIPGNIQPISSITNPVSVFISIRPLLPMFAMYICLIWILLTKSKLIPNPKNPLRYFFFFFLIGIVSSILISSQKSISIYWSLYYLSPLLVIWLTNERNKPRQHVTGIIHISYILVMAVTLSIMPEALRLGVTIQPSGSTYDLPFNIGEMRVNGAARFALVLCIVSVTRFTTSSKKWRFIWIIFLLPSLYLIMQCQSRTALLGFILASIVFIFLKGFNPKFLLGVGPISVYIFWLAAFKWRAQESFDRLIHLSGREQTWERGIGLFKNSPIIGSGFHADRIMLKFEHMHNSYFHTLVQSGALGTIFFIVGIYTIWFLIFRHHLFKRIKDIQRSEQPILIESILILTFLTSRSFFESTAAFYGIDLLLLIPAIVYIYIWIQENPLKQSSEGSKVEEL